LIAPSLAVVVFQMALQGSDANSPFKALIDKELLQLIESWAHVPKHNLGARTYANGIAAMTGTVPQHAI
jgi:hypothetical protein